MNAIGTLIVVGLPVAAKRAPWRTSTRQAVISGDKPVFDAAVADFAEAYAALNAADYQRLLAAIDAGELPCVHDR